MIRTEIKVFSKDEQREVERKLKDTGYNKTDDCMWIKIFIKDNLEIVLSREY